MTERNETMKKQKKTQKIKLRYILPLAVGILSVLVLVFDFLKVPGFGSCSGYVCFPLGYALTLSLNFIGFSLASLILQFIGSIFSIENIIRENVLTYATIGICSLLSYFIIGYYLEKAFLYLKTKK